MTPEALRDASRPLAEHLHNDAEADYQPSLVGPEVLPAMIREMAELRERMNADERRAKKLRDLILPLLDDAGGEFIDETAELRAYLVKEPRWSYDASALHALVPDHLTAAEFSECLKTSVDKTVVEEWVRKGLITDRQLTRVNAKVGTSIVEKLMIESTKGGRRRR